MSPGKHERQLRKREPKTYRGDDEGVDDERVRPARRMPVSGGRDGAGRARACGLHVAGWHVWWPCRDERGPPVAQACSTRCSGRADALSCSWGGLPLMSWEGGKRTGKGRGRGAAREREVGGRQPTGGVR
jgi:hypothetical protein